MTAVAFDTLRFVRTLRDKAKMSPEQAEGLADAISEAIQSDLATKADVEALRLSSKSDIEATRADLRATELRLEAKIEAAKADTIKWVLSAIGFQTLIIVGAVVALSRTVH